MLLSVFCKKYDADESAIKQRILAGKLSVDWDSKEKDYVLSDAAFMTLLKEALGAKAPAVPEGYETAKKVAEELGTKEVAVELSVKQGSIDGFTHTDHGVLVSKKGQAQYVEIIRKSEEVG